MSEWQPIETAPLTGKEFLAVWGKQGNVMQIVRYMRTSGIFHTKGEPLLGFMRNATAWMDLPKPPAKPLTSNKEGTQ